MTYQVVFDVSQRLPQLALGGIGAVALALVIAIGLVDAERLIPARYAVLGLGFALLVLQWLLVGQWPYALALVALALAAIVIERAGPSEATGIRNRVPGAVPLVAGLFILVFVTVQGLAMIPAIDLSRRLSAGEAIVLEGPARIEAFGKSECLTVQNGRFCYSDDAVIPGYNRRRYVVGGLQDGAYVRLSVLDGMIVRLEVRSGG